MMRLVVMLMLAVANAQAVGLLDWYAAAPATTTAKWTPAGSGAVWWLDATDASTITLTSSNTVSQWRDKIDARNFDMTTGATQPIYGTNTQNGLRGIEAISGQGMLATNMAVLCIIGNYQLAIVARPKTLLSGSSHLSTRRSLNWAMRLAYSATDIQNFNTGGGTTRINIGSITNTMLVLRYGSTNAPQISTSVNGGKYSLSATNATYYTDIYNLCYLFGEQQAYAADGIIQEIVAYTNLDPVISQKLEGYLGHKYNISLPTNHPYYGAAP